MKTKPKAIFSLLDTPAFGGAEQYMFSHLRNLQKKGYEIVLATNNDKVKKEILSRLTEKEKKTFHITLAPYRLDAIGNWKGLIKFFWVLPTAFIWCDVMLKHLKRDYSEVICLWPGFSDRLVFSRVAKKYKCPLIWVEIGPLEPTFKKLLGFPRLLYRLAEKYPNHLITTSLFTKQSILNNTHFTDGDVTLVYPGVRRYSPSSLEKYKKKAVTWRKEKEYTKKKILGVVARLASENEVDVVIKAYSLLRKKHKIDTQLVIVGDGPVKNELEDLVNTLGLADYVTFTGFVSEEEKATIISAFDVFIFPRAWELDGFGMTTIEAMSLGIPVLTTAFGPQLEIVTDGKEGYKYKPHDSKDLARHMYKMLTLSPSTRKRMSEASLLRISDFAEDKYLKIMQQAISRHSL